MTGLLLYALVAAGLGQFLPRVTLAGTPFVGLRFFGGYVAFVLAFTVLHVALRVPLAASAWIIVVAAAAGALWAAARLVRAGEPVAPVLLHPAPLLVLLGAGAIVANGGIGYLPYTSDEFSNWLGGSRHIFMAGGYDRVRDVIHLPGYTPGWRLALLFPWAVTGAIDEGDSAAAPFVAHVGLAGLVYDIIVWQLGRLRELPKFHVTLFAWGVLLVGLAAELAGLIWIRTLLIEQPQIYTLAATSLIIVLASIQGEARVSLAAHGGLVIACSYLLKAAAVAIAPSVAVLVLAMAWTDAPRGASFASRVLALAGLALGPLLVAMVTWKLVAPATIAGMPSALDTLGREFLATALARDWRDLAQRYLATVWTYFAEYKTPLTVLSLLAVTIAAVRGRYAALLMCSGFFVVYALVLYWYHLAVFEDYYLKILNSIPRFTRVPIQVLHVVGFVVAVMELVDFLARGRFVGAVALARGRIAAVTAAVGVAGLIGFQGYQVLRSVEDVTTRAYQTTDPRIAEARKAVAIAVALAGRELPAKPALMLIAQGEDSEPLNYATYYARGVRPGDSSGIGISLGGVSWTAGEPQNVWQQKTTVRVLRDQFLAADMIWPLTLDGWVTSILAEIVDDPACVATPLNYYFVRRAAKDGGRVFSCVAKPSP